MREPFRAEKNVVQGAIRVSFDLDEVLFVSPHTHKTEPPLSFPFNHIYKERLRLGTPDLINTLQSEGVEVWVYTSSFRTEKYINGLFRHYKIRFDGIVNAQRHLKEVQGERKEILPQKMPSKYRITLHIDDESVIETSGKAYGFKVYLLNAQDDEWKDKILAQIQMLKKQRFAEESLDRSEDAKQRKTLLDG